MKSAGYCASPPTLERVRLQVYPFFLGIFMSIYLKAEFETEVVGHGDGFISINQKNDKNEEVVIWLSIHQFETIFNHEKNIVREALGLE
jgi:hypothetical protein